MLYQIENSEDRFRQDLRYYCAFDFGQPHMHRASELLTVDKGRVVLQVNSRTAVLSAGDCALILPNQLHSFVSSDDACFWVHVFASEDVPTFFRLLGNRRTGNPRFVCTDEALRFYRSECLIADPAWDLHCRTSYICTKGAPERPLSYRAALYAVLSCYLETASGLSEDGGGEDRLIGQILSFLSSHCTEDLTLRNVAARFNYEPHYLCRYMKKQLNVPFRWLINRCRVDLARQLLETTDKSVSEIAMQCGFGSIRTFDRVFADLEGCTPSSLREKKSAPSSDTE